MFEKGAEGGAATATPCTLTPAEVRAFVERLPSLQLDLPDAQRIDLISSLEAVKGAVAAAQARVTVAFADSQVAADSGRRCPNPARGIGAQVALARRESPSRGSRHLGLARALVGGELPHTMAHLSAGRTTEWRATIVCQETACLTVEQRREVDAALADDLPTLGELHLRGRARALAAEVDNAAVAQRAAQAESARRVTVRPAPTAMVYLTALLPVAQGVAVIAALRKAAAERDPDDARTVDQICADALVERVTGQAKAKAVPIEVQLVMPADTMFPEGCDAEGCDPQRCPSEGGGPDGSGYACVPATDGPNRRVEPATLAGHMVPGSFARRVLEDCVDAGAQVWLRRLFTSPDGADLVALDSRRREFTGMLRRFVELRDQTCRTPWCDAPIRHIDHVHEAHNGGETSAQNGRGSCAACNYAREAPGWSAEVLQDGPLVSGARPSERGSTTQTRTDTGPPHAVRLTTPTGHVYDSTAPPLLPGRRRRPPEVSTSVPQLDFSCLERRFELLLSA